MERGLSYTSGRYDSRHVKAEERRLHLILRHLTEKHHLRPLFEIQPKFCKRPLVWILDKERLMLQ